MTAAISVATTLAELRRRAGLSERQVADACNTFASVIKRVESGSYLPSRALERAITVACGGSVEDESGVRRVA